MSRGVPKEQLAVLRSVPIFDGLQDRDLELIDRLVDTIEVPAGEALTRQGAYGDRQTFVIVSGEASVEIDGRPVARLGSGSIFGEMAMLDGRPRSATVVAVTPMRLLLIGPGAFPTFIAQPVVAMTLVRSLVERLRGAVEHAAEGAA